MRPIFKTKWLIFHSKANLDVKNLFGNATHLIDPEIRKMLERGLYGNQGPHSILVLLSVATEIKIHF